MDRLEEGSSTGSSRQAAAHRKVSQERATQEARHEVGRQAEAYRQ